MPSCVRSCTSGAGNTGHEGPVGMERWAAAAAGAAATASRMRNTVSRSWNGNGLSRERGVG